MFFFGKKRLFDSGILQGFTDIHTHVLAGVDDGAQTMDDTKALLEAMRQQGWSKIVATPHVMGQVHVNQEADLVKRFHKDLQPMAKSLGLEVELAAEYLLDDRMMTALRESRPLLAMDNDFVLVELPLGGIVVYLAEAFRLMKESPCNFILAHPERYPFLTLDDIREMKKKCGVCMQLNLLSLSSYYGTRVQVRAKAMLETGVYDFVGSDMHRMRMMRALAHVSLKASHRRALRKLVKANASIWA